METVAYCTAASYNTGALYRALRDRYEVSMARRVLTVHLDPEAEKTVLFFPYGSLVMWGLTSNEERMFVEMIKPYEDQPLNRYESDTFIFEIGTPARVAGDRFIIPDLLPLTIHSLSHGLAQSVKLGSFEARIQKTYNSVKHIPDDLAKKGRIPLSQKETRKMMGQLFLDRSSINLHLDILDTPEFFWDHNDLQPLYQIVANDLDLATRVEVLNQRLDVVHELFDMLGTELNNQHSSRLEIIIIVLIFIEIMISVFKEAGAWH